MVQQVNLCLPILRQRRSSLNAQTLVQLLALVLPVAGALGAVWVWSLNQASESLRQTLAAQTREVDSLRAALAQGQAGAGSAQASLHTSLLQTRSQLLQRQQALAALQQGRFEPSFGHSARLQLVAQTIPPQAWVSQLRADDSSLEIAGCTLEPEVLTQWVNRLAHSPLLKGQALSTVTVARVKADAPLSTGALDQQSVAAAPTGKGNPVTPGLPARWSFNLLSSLAKPTHNQQGKP
jgi:Tfp pilus assembly protein PilN